MKNTRRAKKLICLVVSVLMLMGMLSTGLWASAASVTVTPTAYGNYVNGCWSTANGPANLTTIDPSQAKTLDAGTYYYVFGTSGEWYVSSSQTAAIITVSASGSVTVQDASFTSTSWDKATFTPKSTHTAAYNAGTLTWGGVAGSTVTIKDGAGNTVNGSASVGIEEGSIFFTAESTAMPIKWSLQNNSCGAQLNDNYNGGALVSFTKIGSVTLVAADNDGGKAEVTINVNNNTIQLNASTVNGAVRNGDTLTIEQGQALEVLVDCTDPSKLSVNKTGTSVTVTQGSTGVPVTVLGTDVGSSKITLEIYGKTLAFTVNVKEATSANFTVDGNPIVGLMTVDNGAANAVEVRCSLAIASWSSSNSDVTVARTGNNTAKITGNKVGGFATVTAYGSNNAVLGTFDVYVTAGNKGEFVEILDNATHSAVSSVDMNVGDTKVFIGDCTIEGEAAGTLSWQLVSAEPAGCVTLTTSGNDGNGNVLATIKAVANGTAVLRATSKGLTDEITIKVGGGTTGGGEEKFERTIVMKKNLTKSWVDGEIRENTKYENGAFAMALSKPEGYLLPVRFVAEKFRMTVNYKGNGVTEIINDATEESLIVTKGSNIIKKYNADGTFKKDVQNEAITESIDTITYVPLRAVSEALGLGVAYRSTPNGSYVVISTDKGIDANNTAVNDYINKAYTAGLR